MNMMTLFNIMWFHSSKFILILMIFLLLLLWTLIIISLTNYSTFVLNLLAKIAMFPLLELYVYIKYDSVTQIIIYSYSSIFCLTNKSQQIKKREVQLTFTTALFSFFQIQFPEHEVSEMFLLLLLIFLNSLSLKCAMELCELNIHAN